MEEILTLHCGIENCNTQYEYIYDCEHIIAIVAQWRNVESTFGDHLGLLSEQPKLSQDYEILIQFPLKIDLSQPFYVTYFEPFTELDGIESEQGIQSMLFCLCLAKKIVELGKKFAKINVEVIDKQNITKENKVKFVQNERSKIIDQEIKSAYVKVLNFEKFSLINANYQSDFGWTYIIEKNNGKYRIIVENLWDFHRNTWQIINEELNQEQVEKYGIN